MLDFIHQASSIIKQTISREKDYGKPSAHLFFKPKFELQT